MLDDLIYIRLNEARRNYDIFDIRCALGRSTDPAHHHTL